MSQLSNSNVRSLRVTPSYKPPETYQGDVSKRVNPHLEDYTHIILVDADTQVPQEFYDLPAQNLDADIIAPKIVPMSRIYRAWEALTYGIRLDRIRIRGSAVIYSTRFLKNVGGYPDVESPDTWLYRRANKVVQVPLKAYHEENFDFRHSIRNQISRGRARAEMKESVWRVVAHSIFRLRPMVLIAYLYYRGRGTESKTGSAIAL